MNTLITIIAATFLISLISFIGVLTLAWKKRKIDNLLLPLVALSAGALMGGAFLHLIPEAIEISENSTIYILIGFIIFFFIEKVLHWRHCHKETCEIHSFAYMNLFGDALHNFIDGLIIAAAMVTDMALGASTLIAIALHEIPQEIGDFGVLVHGGFRKKKALFLNFLISLFAVLGAVIGFFLSTTIQNSISYIIAIAAGGFLYIASSDLIPEMRKAKTSKESLQLSIVFLFGILLMYSLKFIE